jgi:hypothetical protein
MLLPAVLAGGLTALVLQEDAPSVADPLTPREVARLVEQAPALTPVEAAAGVRSAAPEAARPAPPARIQIPEARVDAHVRPVALRGQALEVPRTEEAGWFSGGPRPGEPGRTVLIGHLDGRRGPAVFAGVAQLSRGAPVDVTDASGRIHHYNVVGAAQVRKHRFPVAEVFGASRTPLLVLVTCGGPFEPDRGYRDNVIVYARPV